MHDLNCLDNTDLINELLMWCIFFTAHGRNRQGV